MLLWRKVRRCQTFLSSHLQIRWLFRWKPRFQTFPEGSTEVTFLQSMRSFNILKAWIWTNSGRNFKWWERLTRVPWGGASPCERVRAAPPRRRTPAEPTDERESSSTGTPTRRGDPGRELQPCAPQTNKEQITAEEMMRLRNFKIKENKLWLLSQCVV